MQFLDGNFFEMMLRIGAAMLYIFATIMYVFIKNKRRKPMAISYEYKEVYFHEYYHRQINAGRRKD